jgi:CubicO group peptidase (beta-lactamase class C family)
MPTLDDDAVKKLLARARREVDDGLLPSCQVALAVGNEVVVNEAFGQATVNSRYVMYSCTKPVVAGAAWLLIGKGRLDTTQPVAEYVPEFGENGKHQVTVEQVMLHTSGFPHAPLGPPHWDTRKSRLARFARWRLNWDPGTRYEYHPTSAHWVLAELIERITGEDYRHIVNRRVLGALGLETLRLGVPHTEQGNVLDVVTTGEEASAEELQIAFGVTQMPETEVTDEALLAFNQPDVRAVGVPGGGGITTAADLALFYQALLHNPGDLWHPDVLADATSNVRNRLPDPLMGVPANRSLGLVLAGDDGQAYLRGLGRTASPSAFGHNGAGGQIAFADPATGMSFAYLTNGLDRHVLRQGRRGVALASLAGLCGRMDT